MHESSNLDHRLVHPTAVPCPSNRGRTMIGVCSPSLKPGEGFTDARLQNPDAGEGGDGIHAVKVVDTRFARVLVDLSLKVNVRTRRRRWRWQETAEHSRYHPHLDSSLISAVFHRLA